MIASVFAFVCFSDFGDCRALDPHGSTWIWHGFAWIWHGFPWRCCSGGYQNDLNNGTRRCYSVESMPSQCSAMPAGVLFTALACGLYIDSRARGAGQAAVMKRALRPRRRLVQIRRRREQRLCLLSQYPKLILEDPACKLHVCA